MADYTEQQKLFVATFIEEGRKSGDRHVAGKAALKAAGYSENTPVSSVMKGVKDLLVEEAVLELAKDIPKVLNGMGDVLDNPAIPGANVKLNAIFGWFDRVGITKKEESTVKVESPNSVLILPSKNKSEITN